MNITVFEIIISTYLYFLMKVWGLVRKEKESRHCELIQFQSKSRAVWTLNSIKEKWKTNRTSFPAQTSIRWWTSAGKSLKQTQPREESQSDQWAFSSERGGAIRIFSWYSAPTLAPRKLLNRKSLPQTFPTNQEFWQFHLYGVKLQ